MKLIVGVSRDVCRNCYGKILHVVGITQGMDLYLKNKISHGCGRNKSFVAITVTKIQNLLPFHNCSCMKLPQKLFHFYREVMSKERARPFSAASMEGGTGEGCGEFILRLQWLCAAIACVLVELFRATLVTQSHPFWGDKCTLWSYFR